MQHRLVMFFGIAVCFSLISCDIFKTRTPEEPSQQSSNYIQPKDPSDVLQNMMNAFEDGDFVNYDKSFSDVSFSFTPSINSIGKYNIDWASWNKTQEQTYFKNVLNHFNNSKTVLALEPFTPIYNNSTTYQVETVYHLTLPIESGVVKKFNGQVQFTIVQDQSGNWSISQWVDVGSDSTWSDLKGIANSQWYQ